MDRNCLTCKWEPLLYEIVEEDFSCIGECRCPLPPFVSDMMFDELSCCGELIIKSIKPNMKVWKYENGGETSFNTDFAHDLITDCPAWQQKEGA